MTDLELPSAGLDPLELYAAALDGTALFRRSADGGLVPVPTRRWTGGLQPGDESLLDRCLGPTLDVGCGPGRLLEAFGRLAVPAMGVDLSPAAVRIARSRGGQAVTGSVFDEIPGAGDWATALLLDGNIGIGGDPAALLRRVRALLRPDGCAVVEVEPGGVATTRTRVRLEDDDSVSDWFWWARVGLDGLPEVAADARMAIADVRGIDGRWFAWLDGA